MTAQQLQLLLTRQQCRDVDRHAIEQLGIPGVVLMENAGRNAADLIERWALKRLVSCGTDFAPCGTGFQPVNRTGKMPTPHHITGPLVCIVCGKGNNGGDGFVIARQLVNRGWPVSVDLAAEQTSLTGDAAINYKVIKQMGVAINELSDSTAIETATARWQQAVVIVDALLGTGFTGQVREPLAGIIERMNAVAGKYKSNPARCEAGPGPIKPLMVAIDVPSGLDADTGAADGTAIRAHRTITFLANKIGYQNKTARAYLGRVTVCDIGAPLELILGRLTNQ